MKYHILTKRMIEEISDFRRFFRKDEEFEFFLKEVDKLFFKLYRKGIPIEDFIGTSKRLVGSFILLSEGYLIRESFAFAEIDSMGRAGEILAEIMNKKLKDTDENN